MNGPQPSTPMAGLSKDIADRLRQIRFVLTDVDGTLTDSNLLYDQQGARQRAFSTRDGAGIQWLIQSGIPVGFLSALDDPSTRLRGRDLGVEEIHLGAKDKLATLLTLVERLGLKPEEVAYFGDDLVDLPVLVSVGFSACPSDAAEEVRLASTMVLAPKGGDGFFRAAAELILKAQGRWDAIVGRYRIPSKPTAV